MKYWIDCSKEEKAEMRKLEKESRLLRYEYLVLGILTSKQYAQRKRRLLEKVDKLERKYAE